MVVLLPVTLPLAVLRRLVRGVARALLLVPHTARRPVVLFNLACWFLAASFMVLVLARGDVPGRYRPFVFDWYWQEARWFGYPRLLDDQWRQTLAEAVRGSGWATFRLYGLLAVSWIGGLFLVWVVTAAVRRGFSRAGTSLPPWPYPKPRSPLLLPYNVVLLVAWGWLPAGFVLALPPFVTVFGHHRSADAFVRGWSLLRWLRYPRLFDRRAERLGDAALARFDERPVNLSVTLNRPLVELVSLELLMLGLAGATGLSLVWVWLTWRRAARGEHAVVAPFEAVPRRSSPRWTVVLLPLTFPLALAGVGLWKSPIWLPRLLLVLAKFVLAFAVGCVLAFVGLFVYCWANVNDESDPGVMRWLRDRWAWLEAHTFWADHWHGTFAALPRPPDDVLTGGDVFRAIALVSAAAAPLVALVAMLCWWLLVLSKRTLEVLAR